jgi:hypothetical protein
MELASEGLVMKVEIQTAVDKVQSLMPTLGSEMKLYLEVVLNEARTMTIVRQACSGDILCDLDDDDCGDDE